MKDKNFLTCPLCRAKFTCLDLDKCDNCCYSCGLAIDVCSTLDKAINHINRLNKIIEDNNITLPNPPKSCAIFTTTPC